MRFNPGVPPPAQHLNKAVVKAAKHRRLHGPAHWVTEFLATTVQDLGLPDIHEGGGQGIISGQDADQVCNARFIILTVISVTAVLDPFFHPYIMIIKPCTEKGTTLRKTEKVMARMSEGEFGIFVG